MISRELQRVSGALSRGRFAALAVATILVAAACAAPGAVSLPVHELTRRLRDLPKDRQVVAYCRGPYCVYADDAVRLLRRRGRPARRLEDGFPEWQRANLPADIAAAS